MLNSLNSMKFLLYLGKIPLDHLIFGRKVWQVWQLFSSFVHSGVALILGLHLFWGCTYFGVALIFGLGLFWGWAYFWAGLILGLCLFWAVLIFFLVRWPSACLICNSGCFWLVFLGVSSKELWMFLVCDVKKDKIAPWSTIGFFTNVQDWQYCHYCQLCILFFLFVPIDVI